MDGQTERQTGANLYAPYRPPDYRHGGIKKLVSFWRWGGRWGGGGERGRWIDRQAGPNHFAPSTSLKFGA